MRSITKLLVVPTLLMAVAQASADEAKPLPRFKIDSRTPVSELLPPRPVALTKAPVFILNDLASAPEVMLSRPTREMLTSKEAEANIAHTMAKVNYLNRKNPDGFVEQLLAQRSDLRGLPFRMGKECRTNPERAILVSVPGRIIHLHAGEASVAPAQARDGIMAKAWSNIRAIKGAGPKEPLAADDFTGVVAATAAQILAPESAPVRVSLAKFLATNSHEQAAQALAKMAIFAQENEVRAAAIEALQRRRPADYMSILVQGLDYPLPAVARRAAQALVDLNRKDAVAPLIEVLERPDPRLPVKGADGFMVRELVRINHHRNCLLCHSPGNSPDVPFGVLKAGVPLPTEPFPPPQQLPHYYDAEPALPDIVVRIDTTYLRQDFSLLLPVKNANPWPEMQRFDFLVRSRNLTPDLALAWQDEFVRRTAGQASPYHRAAADALRQLTGRNAGLAAKDWRESLGINAAPR